MSRAHNTWGVEPGAAAPYGQAQYHDRDLHPPGEHPPPPTDYHPRQQQQQHSGHPETDEFRRPENSLPPIAHFSQEAAPFRFQGGQPSVASTSSPYHPMRSEPGMPETSQALPSPLQHDARTFQNYPRNSNCIKSEPSNQDFMSPVSSSPGFQYPSNISRRTSTDELPVTNWSSSMPPPFSQPRRGDGAEGSARLIHGSALQAPIPSGPQAGLQGKTVARAPYRICVRQHPVAARSCGFGERDRRVIDPPPIIQVLVDNPQISDAERSQILRSSYGVMHCTIWTEDGQQDCSTMQDGFRTNRRLMGTPVSSPFMGFDDHDEEGCFYCFPDLSVRTPGSFRLHFSLAILNPTEKKRSVPVVAGVMSDVFKVYNAKDFPGMQASTALTKTLKKQGCLISIKKGKDQTGIPRLPDSDEEDEDDGAGGQMPRPMKKYRK